MGVGLFISTSGFLIPLFLFIRLLCEVCVRRQNLGTPACMWRILLLSFVMIPLTASLPTVDMVFSPTPHAAGRALVAYASTNWGLYILSSKVLAVVACDFISPIIMKELGETPSVSLHSHKFNLTWLTKDLGIVGSSLLIGLIVWFVKYPPW